MLRVFWREGRHVVWQIFKLFANLGALTTLNFKEKCQRLQLAQLSY